MLFNLTKRVEGNEKQLIEIKKKVCQTASSSDSSAGTLKRKISPIVRVR